MNEVRKNRVLHVFSVIATPIAFFDGQFAFFADRGYEIHLIASPSEEGFAFAERNRIVYQPVSVSRSFSPWADLMSILTVRRYIRKNQIDIVVGHTPKGALVAMTASFLAGTKKRVYYRHGLIYTTAKGVKRMVLKLEEQFVSLLATRVVNVSQSLCELAVRDHLNPSKKQTMFGEGTCGGIDAINRFNPALIDGSRLAALRSQFGLPGSCLVLGFVGRLCRDKGIAELYEAFKLIRSGFPELKPKLLLIGPIDTRDPLLPQTVASIESDRDVVLSGKIALSQMPYYYSLMDVFVFPSYREGFGMSVIEASSMEKPVLVSRSHGCVDTIIENETGFFVDITPESICNGVERLLNSDQRKIMGRNGRKRVVQVFDYRVVWPIIEKFYLSL